MSALMRIRPLFISLLTNLYQARVLIFVDLRIGFRRFVGIDRKGDAKPQQPRIILAMVHNGVEPFVGFYLPLAGVEHIGNGCRQRELIVEKRLFHSQINTVDALYAELRQFFVGPIGSGDLKVGVF